MEDNGIDLPRPGRVPVRGERPLHAPGFPDADAMALHGLGLVPMDMSEDEASEAEDSDEDGLDADEVSSGMVPCRTSSLMMHASNSPRSCKGSVCGNLVPMGVCVTGQMQKMTAVGMASVLGS